MLRSKFVKFFMSTLKWQVNSSSNFASFFIVLTDNSSVNFKLILFQLWIKGSHQNLNFETFKCSDEICHIPYVIFQTTSHLKVMLDKSVNNVLAEGMWFLGKCSPLNFNFLDFPQLVWSYPNSSYDFWNLESVLYKFCTIL